MKKVAKKPVRKTLMRRGTKVVAKQMIKPHALMACVLFGLAACSSSDNGGQHNSINKSGHGYKNHGRSSVSSGDYSPYGGTSHPTQVKIGKAYDVNGKTYYPKHEPEYSETGMASWYGPGFDGRQTASGEKYDQYEMTAAHRTLPLPSIVKVTRLDSGESAIVRVNDRGPFSNGRIIDLSKAAASELDMMRDGVARVEVEYLPEQTREYVVGLGLPVPDFMVADGASPKAPTTAFVASSKAPASNNFRVASVTPTPALKPSNQPFQMGESSHVAGSITATNVETFTPTRTASIAPVTQPALKISFTSSVPQPSSAAPTVTTSTDQHFKVQTAAFSDRSNAERHAEALNTIGHASITPIAIESGTFYRVMLGPVNEYQQAASMLRQTQDLGYKDARIMVE